MARFFIRPEQLVGDKVTILGSDAHHLTTVLRAQVGDRIEVTAGMGTIYEVEIVELAGADGPVTGRVLRELSAWQEPPLHIVLFQALAKGDKVEYVIQKAVELGVEEIIVFTSANCVVRLDQSKREKRRQRWQRIAEEAAKQCRRAKLPKVGPILDFPELVIRAEQEAERGVLLIPYELERERGLKSLNLPMPSSAAVVIGPEGGFAHEEISALQGIGGIPITLGPRILRTETAGLVALSLIEYQWGDLGGEVEK